MVTPAERRRRIRAACVSFAEALADILDGRDHRPGTLREPWVPEIATTGEDEQDAARAIGRSRRRAG